MRVIYLSAHLDDAVLSCGGLIFEQVKQGIPVEVWTIMCGAPPDKDPLPYQKRINEDKEAVEMLGAKPHHLCFLDAFGRNYTDVFSPVLSEDYEFVNSIFRVIREGIDPTDIVMCPLAVGGHVDHKVLRLACEKLDNSLVYYADFPYIDYHPDALAPAALEMTRYARTISPEGLSHWKDAVCAYVSQDFYPAQDITRTKIVDYWAHLNGIFLYKKKNVEQIFTAIYHRNQWSDLESVSGPGSRMIETEVVRAELPRIIKQYDIHSLTDVPCGDFLWMRTIDLGISYFGGDVVGDIVHHNEIHYANQQRKFRYVDITSSPIPRSDLLLCRDCLVHLSERDVNKSIRGILLSGCKYLLTTTFPEARGNWDIETGAWRPLNLQALPYYFPTPLELIDEHSPMKLYGPKCLGLWRIEDI